MWPDVNGNRSDATVVPSRGGGEGAYTSGRLSFLLLFFFYFFVSVTHLSAVTTATSVGFSCHVALDHENYV